MKKSLLLFGIGLILMQSCQSDSPGLQPPDELLTDQFKPEEDTGVQHDIMVNILASKFGGYKKGVPNTRAAGAVSLTPYIENGDTLLYIAQYEKGWELYSASTAAPMVIFSSPDGVFDINDPDMPEAMRDGIRSHADAIACLKKNSETKIDKSWGAIAVTEEELAKGKITMRLPDNTRKIVSQSDLQPGHWVLIDSELLEEQVSVSPKLTTTQWGQLKPWNVYCPYKPNDNNKLQQCYVGCVSVALSQYMYFTHYKEGIPAGTVSSAIPTSDGTDFTFGGYSTTIWDNMAKTSKENVSRTNNSALLMGYVGRKVSMNYGIGGSASGPDFSVPYLSSVYGETVTRSDFDYDYVKSIIDKGYPVITDACAVRYSDGSSGYGHYFITDQYKETISKYRYTYAYVSDADHWETGDDGDPWDDGDIDEDGNGTGYLYYNEVEETIHSKEISFNWGYDGDQDDVFYGIYDPWTYDKINYRFLRSIHIRPSLTNK